MTDALAEVKRQLGDNALILHTRTVTRRGRLALRGTTMVEVIATEREEDLPAAARCGNVPPFRTEAKQIERAGGAAESMLPCERQDRAYESRLLDEVEGLRAFVDRLVRQSSFAPTPDGVDAVHKWYTSLVQNEIADQLARDLVSRIRSELPEPALADEPLVRERLAGCVAEMLPDAGEISLHGGPGPTVIAFIGPTGVGKTTTIAKLAAEFALRRHCNVGLITTDAARIGAADQLRTYADIINVPMRLAGTPADLVEAVAGYRERDLVLIDTAGRSPTDEAGLHELKCLLAEAAPHEVHLVLSSTKSRLILETTVERFAILSPDHVILTKLDEALGFGVLLSCLQRARLKLSYVTTGQRVPTDIEPAVPSRLAARIVGGGLLSPAGG